MTATTFDFAAERKAAAERRERRYLEVRAQMLLAGQWHLTVAEIEAAIAEKYPTMSMRDAVQLARVAVEVQRAEAPRRIPIEAFVAVPKQDPVVPDQNKEQEPPQEEEEVPTHSEESQEEETMLMKQTAVTDRDWREDAREALQEVQDEPEVVERAIAGSGSLDYLRLEQEPDGLWVLSASMTFTDVDRARRVLAKMVA